MYLFAFCNLCFNLLNAYKKILIISRTEERGVEHRILRAGADIVVSPLSLGGKHIGKIISQNNQSPVPESLNDKLPSLLGFSLRLFRHPGQDPITVNEALKLSDAVKAIAIKRPDGSIDYAPTDDMLVSSDDALIILIHERS